LPHERWTAEGPHVDELVMTVLLVLILIALRRRAAPGLPALRIE
jgi:hypothetical protein